MIEKMKKIQIVCSAILVCCIAYIANELLIQPFRIDSKQTDIQKIYYDDTESATPKSEKEKFEDLAKINPDIKGWIRIPNTNIDYPVLQEKLSESEFYLNHDYKKSESKEGSIFATGGGYLTSTDVKPITLYGHTLQNGRMFSELKKYRNIDFLKDNQEIYFDRQFGNTQWKIISVFLTNVLPSQGTPFHYTRTDFKDDDDYLNFIYQLKIRSLFNIETGVVAQDQLLLLSTCADDFEDFRLVVVARQLRAGETSTPANISENPKTLYPDCWYERNHSVKPVWPSDFRDAKDLILQ